MKNLTVLLNTLVGLYIFLVMTGCNSIPVKKQYSDYQLNFSSPLETQNFYQERTNLYDNPLYGVSVSYNYKQPAAENITLFVYPIQHFDLVNNERLLKNEINRSIAEVEQAIEVGYYKAIAGIEKSDVQIDSNIDQESSGYFGKVARFVLTHNKGYEIDSSTYLFILEDKFVKFRASFDTRVSSPFQPDLVVQEILPELVVPPESDRMKELRVEYKKEYDDQLKNLLIQTIQEAMEEAGSSTNE